MKTCNRCGNRFDPAKNPLKLKIKEVTHCTTCMCRNLFDALNLPTPPELLDKHSKLPTLTDREFRKSLHNKKKAILSVLLSAALATSAFAGQSSTNSPPVKDSVWLAAFVVTVAIVGLVVVIKVSRKIPGPGATVTLELQKSADHSNWQTVATRTVTLTNGELSASTYFSDQMNDQMAFYRARIARP